MVATATHSPQRTAAPREQRHLLLFLTGLGVLLLLSCVSLFVGVADITVIDILNGTASPEAVQTMIISRIPRTIAVLLAGSSLAIAGLLMQLISANRFVEPSTVGTTESASIGLLAMMLLAPAAPIWVKMLVACGAALLGTWLFLALIGGVTHRGGFTVPLIGIMLGGVLGAVATFVAFQYNLIQSLTTWMLGDFSGTLRGRYELLWLVAVAGVIAYVAADRFTIAGLGRDYATGVGLNYVAIERLGLIIVAVVSAIVVTVVGAIPFLGLVVPNLVSLTLGDNVRRSAPWVALGGSLFVLACDIFARLIRYPFEMPIGTVVGVIGAIIFLSLLLRKGAPSA